jgi:cytochrome c oxidase assembly protein subunit 15
MRDLSSTRGIWLQRFAWLLAAITLFLICSGGMVTSKNAGLAVPDWPSTFGYNMFPVPPFRSGSEASSSNTRTG